MAAFSGFTVGSRLILTRDAGRELCAGNEVEVVKMLGPEDNLREQDDGVRVQRVVDGEPTGETYEFVWECGARYFK